MIFNKVIFKRFFFRKNQNSSTDWGLPTIFIAIVALSSALIFFSSIQLYDYQNQKDQYLSNKANNMYELFIGDTIPSRIQSGPDKGKGGFAYFQHKLESDNKMSFYRGFRRSPKMMHLTSSSAEIPWVQSYLFGKEDSALVNILAKNQNLEDDFLYLSKELMADLNVSENDFILIRKSKSDDAYLSLLPVKEIKSDVWTSSYAFKYYLQDTDDKAQRKVRFYFNDITKAISLIHQLKYDLDIPAPFYLGVDNGLMDNNFLMFTNEKNYKKRNYIDKPIGRGRKNDTTGEYNNWNFLNDEIMLTYEGCEDSGVIYHAQDVSEQDINFDLIDQELKEKCNSIKSSLINVDLFNDKNPPSVFYVEFDLRKNLVTYKSEDADIRDIQKQILSLLNNHDGKKEFKFKQNNPPRRGGKRSYVYYNSFDDELNNIDVMNQLNSLNVRWDNARWKTIIDLNRSLEEGKRNIITLITANIIVFFLILAIKFILRLKLELHSIGVLKCFGYSKKVIYFTYNMGNLIMIFVGFLIGVIPLGIGIAKLTGYSIANFYTSEYFFYCLVFLFSSMIASLVTTTYFLSRYTEKDNIYELIKYES